MHSTGSQNHSSSVTKSALRSNRKEKFLLTVAVILLFGALFTLLLGLNMRRGLNHDEHQFVAGATLLAREALLPYADFAYFHVPLLSLTYAVIYQSSQELLLRARLVSVFFSWLTLGLIFFAAYRRRVAERLRIRLLFATMVTLWLMSLPIFTYTSGRAWNHDLPVFLMLLAFFIHSDALVERRSPFWLGASGLLMGLASVTRLSFALTALPFLLVIWLYPAYKGRTRWIGTGMFLIGYMIGAIPAIVLFFVDPAAFLFGNVEYVRLNTLYYQQQGQVEAMTLIGKLVFLGRLLVTQPGNLIAVIVLVFGSVPLLDSIRHRLPGTRSLSEVHDKASSLFRYVFAILLLLFSLIGAFAATPSQPQYFYVLFPLVVLSSAYAFNAWPTRLQPRGVLLLAGAILVTVLLAIPIYAQGLAVVFTPGEWYPRKLHARAQMAAQLVQHSDVLTLSPIYPLEGEAQIYPEFATGPFGWRVAPLVDKEQREQFHLVAPNDLDEFLATDPPRGILVGLDNDDLDEEMPFVAYARQHDYVPVDLPDEGTLWLSPLAAWKDSILLGGYTTPEQPVQPGDTVDLSLYLQNRSAIDDNLNVLVRLVGVDGSELLRDEGWPWGSPTSIWALEDVWPDGHQLAIPETAQPGYYAIEVVFYNPADLELFGEPAVIGHLAVGNPDFLNDESAPLARFGSDIALLQAELPEGPLQPGDRTSVRLVWRGDQRSETDYTIFVHLLDTNGNLVAQVDTPPLGGFYPTSAWLPGMPVADELELMLPADLPAGRYQVSVGMYDPVDQQRLFATLGSPATGLSVDNGAAFLGTIDVE
jgi:hypothetical protein